MDIKNIINELTLTEPSFKGQEAELEKVVSRLLAGKPTVKIDAYFVSQLRKQLLSGQEQKINKFNFNFMNKWQIFGAAGVAAVIMIVIVASGYDIRSSNSLNFGQPGIARLGEGAFGSLLSADASATGESQNSGRGASGFGGGGGGGGLGTDIAKSSIAPGEPMPDYGEVVVYRYIYSGDPISFDNDKYPVYKRVMSSMPSGGLISGASMGLIDKKLLQNSRVRSISFIDKSADRWSTYSDFDQGTISMYKEYYQPIAEPYQPLNPADLPADDKIIAMANQAIKNFGIKLDGYGSPVVMNDWRLYYARLSDAEKMSYFAPDFMTVVYPQKIKGQTVYEQGGSNDGIMVNVNVRTGEVNSINNISTQNFQSSDYAIQKDVKVLLEKFSSQFDNGYPPEVSKRYVDVTLGTPTFDLVKIYRYENGQNDILYVPGLSFPVISSNDQYPYWSEKVVLPLVEELLNY